MHTLDSWWPATTSRPPSWCGTPRDAALALYLTKADPLLVLRDLLGHSTVITTEKYLRGWTPRGSTGDLYEPWRG